MGIALEDAYETLHKALLQLGPTKKDTLCVGEKALNDARESLEMLQRSIVAHQEGIHVPEITSVGPVSFNFNHETLEEARRLRDEHMPGTSMDDVIQVVLRAAITSLRQSE